MTESVEGVLKSSMSSLYLSVNQSVSVIMLCVYDQIHAVLEDVSLLQADGMIFFTPVFFIYSFFCIHCLVSELVSEDLKPN